MDSSPLVTLPRLNAQFLQSHPDLSPEITRRLLPEKVLQFGTGVFLRGFVDWMIDGMNRKGLFNGSVVVVPSIAPEIISKLDRQNCAYTHLARGLENRKLVEQQQVVASISRGIDPYVHFDEYLQCAHNPELRFIVSNTTEAGIVYRAEDKQTDRPPASFPAKLTLLLIERYKAFNGDPSKGFVLLPCELIERNGDTLKNTVLQMAKNWDLDPTILDWIENANVFTNTLVDRIVTGFPRDEIEALWQASGYTDDLFNTSDVFHLWVIEGPAQLATELPLQEAGFNVIFTDDIAPYRNRKVRILNGAHTVTALAAYLAGKDLVGECMSDPLIGGFMKRAIYDEVIPTLSLPKEQLESFAAAVFERFSNPFIKHSLLSISLNSVSKYKARLLPSIEQYLAIHGRLPARLVFGLAALIAFYRGTSIQNGALVGHRDGKEYRIQDSPAVLQAFADLWSNFDRSTSGIRSLTDAVLRREDWWGKDLRQLPGMAATVSGHLESILNHGMKTSLQHVS
ncbi:MAG: tagaturonate reductase [Acidobacteriaceae bacterium]